MMGTEIIYGVNPVIEALRAVRRPCHELFISLGRREAAAAKVAEEAAKRGLAPVFVTKERIAALCGTQKNQGVAARVDRYPYFDLDPIVQEAVESAEKAFFLVLDSISDPQNLGSLVRTASLLGAHCVIIPKDNAAGVTPVVVKASAGATEHIPIVRVTNLARTIKYLKEKGIWVAGLDSEGAESIYACDFEGLSVALVMGSEGSGLRRLIRQECDFKLFLPMKGRVSSYNVAVAGALAMGEVARQRDSALCKKHT